MAEPDDNTADCIDACNECADACDRCAAACLGEEDVKSMARCIGLDIDCAAICRLAAGFMGRGSAHAPQLCRACADVCRDCGNECMKHDADHCRLCAEACRQCAQACEAMAVAR